MKISCAGRPKARPPHHRLRPLLLHRRSTRLALQANQSGRRRGQRLSPRQQSFQASQSGRRWQQRQSPCRSHERMKMTLTAARRKMTLTAAKMKLLKRMRRMQTMALSIGPPTDRQLAILTLASGLPSCTTARSPVALSGCGCLQTRMPTMTPPYSTWSMMMAMMRTSKNLRWKRPSSEPLGARPGRRVKRGRSPSMRHRQSSSSRPLPRAAEGSSGDSA